MFLGTCSTKDVFNLSHVSSSEAKVLQRSGHHTNKLLLK